MSDWLLNLPVLWMAVVVFAATYLLAASMPRRCGLAVCSGTLQQEIGP